MFPHLTYQYLVVKVNAGSINVFLIPSTGTSSNKACVVIHLSVPVCVNKNEGFHVDLDDFLMGLLLVASELVSLDSGDSKLCKNSPGLGENLIYS
jgi:hypothetical protein